MTASSATEARDTGAALALDAEARKYELERAITKAARLYARFTVDEVWAILESWGINALDHANAMGAMFLDAARAGVIEPTRLSRRSVRTLAHRRKVTVWRSLIFGTQA